MRISVLIIAHNEEAHIAECIESVLRQTQKADEVVLLLHNSTDATKEIAEKYPITVIPYIGPTGIARARIEGLKHVSGDIVCCIDGDSYANNNWIEELAKTLSRGNVLVGSWMKFKGTFFGDISNISNKYLCRTKGEAAAAWIWGPSFAFWGRDKSRLETIYAESIELSQKLGLSRNPEDYWLALFMSKTGPLEVTNKTYVVNHIKEKTNSDAVARSRENINNGEKILRYFKNNCL